MFMLQKPNVENRSNLRCVWVPAHSGARAPLTAVWIATDPAAIPAVPAALQHEDAEIAAEEPDRWRRAA